MKTWKHSDLDKPLIKLNSHDSLTYSDLCKGVMVFGETGSGKTSSLRTFADAFLKAGMGGLALTVKLEECEELIQYCEDAGRADDVIVLGPKDCHLNFLDQEMRGVGPDEDPSERIMNVVSIISAAAETIAKKTGAGGSHNDIWSKAMRQMLQSIFTIAYAVDKTLIIENIYKYITGLPMSLDAINNAAWRETSDLWKLALKVQHMNSTANLEASLSYCLEQFPVLANETATSVLFTVRAIMDPLQREPLRSLLAGKTDFGPEETRNGKIFIVNMAVQKYGDVGAIAQIILKSVFQSAWQRNLHGRFCFLWSDEVQHFITTSDALFQSTARSNRVISCYQTQNKPLLVNSMGNDENAADSLLSNLTTKLFFLNSDTKTNDFASDRIGRQMRRRTSHNKGSSFSGSAPSFNSGSSTSEQNEHIVPPIAFSKLRNGGSGNKLCTDAILYTTGKVWRNGSRYLKLTFHQGNLGRRSLSRGLWHKITGKDFVRLHRPFLPTLLAGKMP